MTEAKWHYLRKQAEARNERYIRCEGVIYEVTRLHFATGRSPLWEIREVHPVDVPAFVPEEEA